MKRPSSDIKQLAAPAAPAGASRPTLRTAQNACYEALSLALKEGHVFAALTGPEGAGKTTVLEAVLSDRTDRALRCIRISDPDKVPASLAEQIEQVAYAEAGKPENLDRHIVLAIDDAHGASHELLLCLSRLAAMREPGRRVPQILLVGRPELWARLESSDEYQVLGRRLAIRLALPTAEEDADPWASVEDEVTQTMTLLRVESASLAPAQEAPDPAHEQNGLFGREYGSGSRSGGRLNGDPTMANEGEVPPPSTFALFPDPPPKASRSAARDTRRRLVLPLVSLFVGLAAFAFALSFYDWPDLLPDLPWSQSKPTTPFIMPRSPQSQAVPAPPSPTPTPLIAAPRSVTTLPKSAPASNPVPAPQPSVSQPPKVQPPTLQAPIPTPAAPTLPTPTLPTATLPTPTPPAPSPPARQIAIAPPLERPAVPVVPAEAEPAPPVTAQAPTRPEPAPPPIAAAPAPVTTAAAPAPAIVVPASPSRAPVVTEASSLSPVVMALLLRRGDEESAIGDISAARLLYERAAEAGSGVAARQLARSYDPAFLPPAVANTLADLGKAKQWYQRAAALGNLDAGARLKALNQGR